MVRRRSRYQEVHKRRKNLSGRDQIQGFGLKVSVIEKPHECYSQVAFAVSPIFIFGLSEVRKE